LPRADTCSDAAFAAAIGALQATGIAVSRFDDVAGLAVLRTVAMLANEAADAVMQGVAAATAVDLAMEKGVNYPRGPMAWADDIGVGIIRTALLHLAAHYGEDRYRLSPLIARRALTGALAEAFQRAAPKKAKWRESNGMGEHHPALSPTQAQALAERVAQEMYERDLASQRLGMHVVRVAPGHAEVAMTVRADMLNGHAICHGGFIFTLADSAFAYACNSYNLTTVASGCTIDFLAPAREGDVLTGHRPGEERERAHRRLRHRSRQRTRRSDRAVPRQELSDQGSCDRAARGPGLERRKVHEYTMPVKKPKPGDLEPIETASRDALEALQLERLRWSLLHAYQHVPHYRRSFDAIGAHPRDVSSLADLAQFPFTSKQDLRDNYPFAMFAVPREQVVRIHASSGTTGRPTVVGYTAKDIDTWASVMARSIRAAGGRAGDIIHVAYGYGLFTGGLGAHYGAEKLGATVIPMSGGMTERQVALIQDFKPDIIMVTPSYMLAIAEEMERQHVDPRQCSLSVGIFGAEPWTPAMRTAIEAKLDIDAIDIYGLSEIIGPGVAQECIETKDGLTVWEDHFYPEIIDPVTGDVLPEGEKGELVLTSLTKEALADDSLSHPRPHAFAAADGPLDAPDREDHRPLRRHADHSRRQCVPDADRRADPEAAGTDAALRAGSDKDRARWTR
jgi:phenylacetate-CoA ligase